jgi:hypothetical protein
LCILKYIYFDRIHHQGTNFGRQEFQPRPLLDKRQPPAT